MARRMFSTEIVASDAFLDMSVSARELYFQLGMYADDDGFVNPKRIIRMVGASEDDLRILMAKRFVLTFESGVIVIKHWLHNNLIRADLYKETTYKKEKAELGLNENGSYTELRNGVSEIKNIEAPKWLKKRKGETVKKRTANGTQSAHRIGKDRIGKVSIVKDRIGKEREIIHTSKYGSLNDIKDIDLHEISDHYHVPIAFVKSKFEDLQNYCGAHGKKYKNYRLTLMDWVKKDAIKIRKEADGKSKIAIIS